MARDYSFSFGFLCLSTKLCEYRGADGNNFESTRQISAGDCGCKGVDYKSRFAPRKRYRHEIFASSDAMRPCFKKLEMPYRSGRSRSWIKVKNPKVPSCNSAWERSRVSE